MMMRCIRYRPMIEPIFPLDTHNSGRTCNMRSSPLDATKRCDLLAAEDRQTALVQGE